MKAVLHFFLVVVLAFTACESDDVADLPSVEDQTQIYIDDNQLTGVQTTPEGLMYIIEDPGNSVMPTISSTVEVRYRGELYDGTVFDQTADNQTATFGLGRLIPAWQIGIPLIGEGGSILLICPPELAYGSRGQGGIPPNAVLGFEIDLVSVSQ